MARIVRGGLIQCANPLNDESQPVEKIKQAALEAHMPFIEQAGKEGVQVLCLQEIFNGPYFCPGQSPRWYAYYLRSYQDWLEAVSWPPVSPRRSGRPTGSIATGRYRYGFSNTHLRDDRVRALHIPFAGSILMS